MRSISADGKYTCEINSVMFVNRIAVVFTERNQLLGDRRKSVGIGCEMEAISQRSGEKRD